MQKLQTLAIAFTFVVMCFSGCLETDEDRNIALTGLWFRKNDKIQRLKNLLMNNRKSAVQGEPMEDAYLDVSNYGIMATIVSRGKWGK